MTDTPTASPPLRALIARLDAFVRSGLEHGDLAPSGDHKITRAVSDATGVRDAVNRLRDAALVSGLDIHPTALRMLVAILNEHDLPDLLFLDTETLGLDPYAPIWELAAVRRSVDTGAETELHLFVTHDPKRWLDTLDDSFADDYRTRYDADAAVTPYEAAHLLAEFAHSTPILVGAVPSFDAERIARQWLEPLGIDRPWHYHLECVSTLVRGWLRGRGEQTPVKLSSDALARRIGVDPADYPRHTAMGDVRWTMAQWDAVHAEQEQR